MSIKRTSYFNSIFTVWLMTAFCCQNVHFSKTLYVMKFKLYHCNKSIYRFLKPYIFFHGTLAQSDNNNKKSCNGKSSQKVMCIIIISIVIKVHRSIPPKYYHQRILVSSLILIFKWKFWKAMIQVILVPTLRSFETWSLYLWRALSFIQERREGHMLRE